MAQETHSLKSQQIKNAWLNIASILYLKIFESFGKKQSIKEECDAYQGAIDILFNLLHDQSLPGTSGLLNNIAAELFLEDHQIISNFRQAKHENKPEYIIHLKVINAVIYFMQSKILTLKNSEKFTPSYTLVQSRINFISANSSHYTLLHHNDTLRESSQSSIATSVQHTQFAANSAQNDDRYQASPQSNIMCTLV